MAVKCKTLPGYAWWLECLTKNIISVPMYYGRSDYKKKCCTYKELCFLHEHFVDQNL